MILRTLLRVIWTAAAVAAGLAIAQEKMETWLLVSFVLCIVIAWAIVLKKLDDVVLGLNVALWLLLILGIIGALVALFIGDRTIPDWTALAFFLIVFGAWAFVLKREYSLKWPLIILSVFALLGCGVWWLGLIGVIGVGKLIIGSIGKRNAYARSRLHVRSMQVSPRGLVEHDNRGFGLVGVIVGIAILTIALTMAVSSFYSASKLTKQAANFTRASNIAEGVMERVKSQTFESIHTGEIKNDANGCPNAKCMLDVTVRESGLKEVLVNYSWTEGTRHREVRFSTLIAKGRLR